MLFKLPITSLVFFYLDFVSNFSNFYSLEILGFYPLMRLFVFFFLSIFGTNWLYLAWFFFGDVALGLYACALNKTALIHVLSVISGLAFLTSNHTSCAVSFLTSSGFIRRRLIGGKSGFNFFFLFFFTLIYGAYWASSSSIGWGWDIIELCPVMLFTVIVAKSHLLTSANVPFKYFFLGFYLYILVRTGYYSTMHHISIPPFSVKLDSPLYSYYTVIHSFAPLAFTMLLCFFNFITLRPQYSTKYASTVFNINVSYGTFKQNQLSVNYKAYFDHLAMAIFTLMFLSFPQHTILNNLVKLANLTLSCTQYATYPFLIGFTLFMYTCLSSGNTVLVLLLLTFIWCCF